MQSATVHIATHSANLCQEIINIIFIATASAHKLLDKFTAQKYGDVATAFNHAWSPAKKKNGWIKKTLYHHAPSSRDILDVPSKQLECLMEKFYFSRLVDDEVSRMFNVVKPHIFIHLILYTAS